MTQLPAWLENDNDLFAPESLQQNLGIGQPPYVSIAGNRFTLIDAIGDELAITTVDPKTGIQFMDVCIVDWLDHPSKIFYARAYDPSGTDTSPPDCWSDNGLAPSANASVPQSATCAGCPQAVWGSKTSKVSGKGVPACGKYQKLALAFPGTDKVFLLRVPPNSLENLRNYNKKFIGQKVSVASVITRISLEKDTIGTLTFQAVNYIDQPMAVFRNKLRAEKATDLLVGRGDRPIAALAAPTQEQPRPLAGPQQPSQPLPAPAAAFPTQAMPGAPAAAPGPAGEPARGRGRPRRAAEPAPAANAQAPFRPEAPNGNFGIAEPMAPTQEITQALDSIFSS